MIAKQVEEIFDILDRPDASAYKIKELFQAKGADNIQIHELSKDGKKTESIKIKIEGKNGKKTGGSAPTLGILGRLGGLGARPVMNGFVSDGDGALASLSAALKLIEMKEYGDVLNGDVIISTHICPNAPTMDHKPVPFMGNPVDMEMLNESEVDEEMDAILSIDTTKGNRLLNHNGFAITPTVKNGYILRVSEDLLGIMEISTGEFPWTFPITDQDITPYGNGLYHVNSILQPCTHTDAPVVGVAITTQSMVPGCATGATHLIDVEETVRFVIEVAKKFGNGECEFFDKDEFELITKKYGSKAHFRTLGI